MPAFSSATHSDSFVDAGEARLHFAEISGPARPMILLHGIGMDWRVWQAVSRRLRPHFHLFMVDLRGHGKSDKPDHGYSLAHYAADVEDAIEALGLERVVLVGSSLGGMVAASVEAPVDVVSHRILVDPPMTGGPVRDPGQFRDILALKHEPVEALTSYLAQANPGAGGYLLRTMSEMWHEAADGVITDMLARSDDYFFIDSALRANDSPTLVMRADPSVSSSITEREAERALSLLSRGESVLVPGAGHAIHASRPGEFTRLILDFTGETPG